MPQPLLVDVTRDSDLRLALEMLALDAARDTLRRVAGYWAGLKVEKDIEAVHRMRTGLNRLRSLLRLVGPVCQWPGSDSMEAVLKRWQRRLGPVRDLDVLIQHLAGLVEGLEGPARKAGDSFLALLKRRRARLYRSALESAGKGKARETRSQLAAFQAMIRRRRRGFRRIRKGTNAISIPNPEHAIHLIWSGILKSWKERKTAAERMFHGPVLHEFRLVNKRMRHVLQLFHPLGAPGIQELLRLVDDLHETLGLLHDYEVLIGEAETLSAMLACGGGGSRGARGLTVADVALLLRVLEDRRREVFGRVLGLWAELHRKEMLALVEDPVKTPQASRRKSKTS